MSNPCINRWGLNAFWHHFWYSDSRYALNLQQDKIFTDLVQVYLTYGSNAQNSLFWNNFWYKTSKSPAHSGLQLYYRWLTVHNEALKMTTTYRLRLHSEETFQTRVSVLRFSSWWVINLYWFQPDKDKNKRARRAKLGTFTNLTNPRRVSPSTLIKFSHLVPMSGADLNPTPRRYSF